MPRTSPRFCRHMLEFYKQNGGKMRGGGGGSHREGFVEEGDLDKCYLKQKAVLILDACGGVGVDVRGC